MIAGLTWRAARRPAGRDLLAGKVVVVTAAAGTGIGAAAARRCLEEGARWRSATPCAAARRGARRAGAGARGPGLVAALRRHRRGAGPGAGRRDGAAVRPDRRDDQQRGPGRHQLGAGDDRRAVAAGAGRHADRDVPLHQGRAAPDGRAGRRRRRRQQRLGARLAGPARPGALRGGEGGRHGADPVRGDGRGRARDPGQRGVAEPGHASVPGQGDERGRAGRAGQPGGVRPLGPAVGGRERDGLPGQRLRLLPDRRGLSVSSQHP